jgi:hypothetical protein
MTHFRRVARSSWPGFRARLPLIALATIGCVAAAAAPASAAFDLVDPARIPANPYSPPSGGVDTSRNSDETAQALRPDAENADSEFHKDGGDGGGGGGGGGSSSSNPSQIPSAEDWCRWWAFNTTAQDIQADPSIDVYQELEGDLESCLNQYYGNDPNVSWVAEYLALQNISALLTALNPGETTAQAYAQLVNGGVTLPTQTWTAWFTASAESVPSV